MIQIRGNGLLTIIKVDAITRDVEAVARLRESLISPPSVFSLVKHGRCLSNVTLRHNMLPFPGNINKKQYHHRQINKHIKQDWGDRNSWKSAAQSGSFVGMKTVTKGIYQQLVFLDKNNQTEIKWLEFTFNLYVKVIC